MAYVQDDNGYWYDDTFQDVVEPTDPWITYGSSATDLVNPDSSFADLYNLTPEAGDSITWTEADKQAAIKAAQGMSNANTATSGGPGTTTDYIGALVAAVKSGALTSEALKSLSGPVQSAVTKALTAAPAAAPSFLDSIGNFLKTSTGQAVGIGGIAALLQAMGNKGTGEIYKGYQGSIPNYSATRTMNAIPTTTTDASGNTVARRPGQGGITYFSPMRYTAAGSATSDTAPSPAAGIAALPTSPASSAPAAGIAASSPAPDAYSRPTLEFSTPNVVPYEPITKPASTATVSASDAPASAPGAYSRPTLEFSTPNIVYMPPIARAAGGLSSLGGYSDGGRLLRGPGDGISDSIPATIGKKQPARLADGEFVVPARIVSEIGNGSTEAGARKLYAMMDRVQKARGKTLKNVAANSRADKYLPA